MINIKILHNKTEDKIRADIYLDHKLIQSREFENNNDSYLFSEGFGEGIRAAESIAKEKLIKEIQS